MRKYLTKKQAAMQVYVTSNILLDRNDGRGLRWDYKIVCSLIDDEFENYNGMTIDHMAVANAIVRALRDKVTRPILTEEQRRKKELRRA